jgi:predicted NAD/FAD-dependent oxidoreductase/geranylgeranyl pyrophosphate synthase
VLNTGATFFASFYDEVLSLCSELGVPLVRPRIHPSRAGRLREMATPGGRIPFRPSSPAGFLRFPGVPAGQKLRVLAALLRLLPERGLHVADPRSLVHLDGEDAETWARRELGDEATDYLVRPAFEPFFYIEAGRVSAATVRALIRHALDWSAITPAAGMGSFCEAMATRLDVRTSTPVRGIGRTARGWRVEHDGGQLDVDAVILATPAPDALALDAPIAADDARDLASIEYEACTCVFLGYDSPPRLPSPSTTVGGPGRHALVGLTALGAGGTPGLVAAGREVVAILAMGWRSRELHGLADGEVVRELVEDARGLGVELPAPSWSLVFARRRATVVPPPGMLRRVLAFDERPRTGLHFAGDWLAGLSTVEGAVRTGLSAARRVTRELGGAGRRPAPARTAPGAGDVDLDRFAASFRRDVQPVALDLLGVEPPRALTPARRWVLAPVLHTLALRRNLFRAAFAVESGHAVGDRPAGLTAAAAAEAGWTAVLVADDLLDRSVEREGHPAAHEVYGAVHSLVSVAATLWSLTFSVLRRTSLDRATRLEMVRLGALVTVRSLASQLPHARPCGLQPYFAHARAVNSVFRFALLAPLGRRDPEAAGALRRYADALAVNGKLRNDLLDYCGGSSESDTTFGDFERRTPTFPIWVLLEQRLDPRERSRVRGHFGLGGADGGLALDELRSLFARHGTFERCLEIMRLGAEEAERATDAASERLGRVRLVELMSGWNRHVVSVAEERVRAGFDRREPIDIH